MLRQLIVDSKSYHFPHKMHRRRRMGSTCRSFTQKLAPKVWFWFAKLSLSWVCGKERCTRTLNGILSTLSPPDPLGRLGCTHCQESNSFPVLWWQYFFWNTYVLGLIFIIAMYNTLCWRNILSENLYLIRLLVGLMLLKTISDHQPITC